MACSARNVKAGETRGRAGGIGGWLSGFQVIRFSSFQVVRSHGSNEFLGSMRILVLELNLLDFLKRDKDFLGGMTAVDLQMQVVGGNPADALAFV